MSEVDELVAWLTEVLDEIERVATKGQRAIGGNSFWSVAHSQLRAQLNPHDFHIVVDVAQATDYRYGAALEHAALHDPRAVLARVECERAMLHDTAPHLETLRLLAYGHRYDWPGYQPTWAPTRFPKATQWGRWSR